jgi:hypothetical protein
MLDTVRRPYFLTFRLCVEELEPRQLLAAPTVAEQVLLERLNDARADPAAYGQSIGLDLSGVAPSQPLAFDARLIDAARNHSLDMNNRGFFDHVNPGGGGPGQRLAGAGYPATSFGESIAAGFPSVESALSGLIRDDGVPDLGHRRHLLAIDAVFQGQRQVGIGVVQNGGGPLRHYYTIDTASTGDTRPFITGVAFNDGNGNGRYDAGEGLEGVTITVSGVGAVGAFSTGGYSMQVGPGTYTVTASGGALGAGVTQTVTVGGSNVRLNFTPGGGSSGPAVTAGYVNKLYERALGRPASAQEAGFWVGSASSPAALASAIERSVEARSRLVQSWYATYLGREAAAGEVGFWALALAAGMPEEQGLASILGSEEYRNRASAANGGGDAGYIQGLYTQLLGRAARPDEVAYWVSQLPSRGAGGVASFFVASPEYRTGQIVSYYVTLLRREPDPGGVAFWVGSGVDLTSIRVLFETAPEFVNG